MGRKLTRTVVTGGVIYPAGTPATKELEEKIRADFWTGSTDADAADAEQKPKRATKRAEAKSED